MPLFVCDALAHLKEGNHHLMDNKHNVLLNDLLNDQHNDQGKAEDREADKVHHNRWDHLIKVTILWLRDVTDWSEILLHKIAPELLSIASIYLTMSSIDSAN